MRKPEKQLKTNELGQTIKFPMPDVYDGNVDSFGLKLTKTSDAKITISFDGEQCYDITDLDEVQLIPSKHKL